MACFGELDCCGQVWLEKYKMHYCDTHPLLLSLNCRKGRSAPQHTKPQSPSACPTVNAWVSVSTGPTTAVCVQMAGAARPAAPAPYPWPLFARMASASRSQPCSSSHVNAGMTVAISMKRPSHHSTGCMETHTNSLTSRGEIFFFYWLFFEVDLNDSASWRRKTFQDEGPFLHIWLQVGEDCDQDHRAAKTCLAVCTNYHIGNLHCKMELDCNVH